MSGHSAGFNKYDRKWYFRRVKFEALPLNASTSLLLFPAWPLGACPFVSHPKKFLSPHCDPACAFNRVYFRPMLRIWPAHASFDLRFCYSRLKIEADSGWPECVGLTQPWQKWLHWLPRQERNVEQPHVPFSSTLSTQYFNMGLKLTFKRKCH